MIRCLFLLAAVGVSSIAMAQSSRENTLCENDEVAYFSCKLKKPNAFVSLCAKGNNSPQAGYVQYKHGRRGNIDMMFPKTKQPPRGLFRLSIINRFRDGIGKHILFSNSNYTYIISNAVQPAEIGIFKNGKLIGVQACQFSGGFDGISYDADIGIERGAASPLGAFDGSR